MPTGRPSEYSEDIAARILAKIATTRIGLQSICDSDEDFPYPSTVYLWLMQNAAFSERYARAKEDQMQVLEDEIIELADNTKVGETVTHKGDGSTERKVADMIEHRKLQIETRKWLMGKLKPKKYGDRTVLAGDKDAPLGVQLIHSVPQPDRGEK
jgi:hypothetical protein